MDCSPTLLKISTENIWKLSGIFLAGQIFPIPKRKFWTVRQFLLTDAVFYLSKTKNLELPEKTTYVRKVIILLDAIPDAELSTLQCELHTSGLDILPYTHLTASDKSFFALAGIELLTERLSISASGHLDHYTTDACNKVIKFQL